MSGLGENKKRKAQTKCLCLIGILLLSVIQAGAEPKDKLLFGVYTGLSFGLGYEFNWQSSGHYSEGYYPIFHLGGYAQYNFSEWFGLQFNANFQGIAHLRTFSNFNDPLNSGTGLTGFISFNLNAVFNYLRLKNAQFYLLGGGGINPGGVEVFDGLCFNFAGGTGVKIYLKPDSQSAINIGGTFQHLLKPKRQYYSTQHANYLRFNIGYEFYPNDHKD